MVKLRKVGDSTVITIPKVIRETLEIQIGDEVDFDIKENTVRIKKADQK